MDPVVLVVAADAREGERLLDELGRYRRDQRLEVVSSAAEAIARLAEIDAVCGSVAMVLADLVVGSSHGVEVPASVRSLNPTVRCVLLIEWGLRAGQMGAVSRALTLGVVDTVLTKPTGPRDEEFHTAITEDLGEWAWTTAPPGILVERTTVCS